MKAYSEAAKGITLDEEAAPVPTPSTLTAAASARQMTQVTPAPPPQPKPLPPGVVKAVCFQCKKAFGVPVGARMVACPHCQAVNQLQESVTPTAQVSVVR